MMMGLGGMFAFVGGWIIAIPGFILSMYASATLAKEWAYSAAGAFGIWLLLVMGTLALSWGIILAACSHARI